MQETESTLTVLYVLNLMSMQDIPNDAHDLGHVAQRSRRVDLIIIQVQSRGILSAWVFGHLDGSRTLRHGHRLRLPLPQPKDAGLQVHTAARLLLLPARRAWQQHRELTGVCK